MRVGQRLGLVDEAAREVEEVAGLQSSGKDLLANFTLVEVR